MNDTRALLNRIAEFRKRLEAMPRLNPGPGQSAEGAPRPPLPADGGGSKAEAGSRTQTILEDSLRQLDRTRDLAPPTLSNRARRLLADAQGLVTRMKMMADDPVLAGPPPGTAGMTEAADPLAVHYRETAALTDAAVRYALTLPESAAEQRPLCEGLEAMIEAGRRRFDLLAGALARRRFESARIDTLARFLHAVATGDGPIDPGPVVALADALLAEEPGRPLRFLSAQPASTQAWLGSAECPAPARFVAAHSLNCACILARIARHDPDWRERARDVVLAGLLHDVGMVRTDPALLAHAGTFDDNQRRAVEAHALVGAERIAVCLPGLSESAEAAASHHERADGSGYPAGLNGEQVSPLSRLIAAADVYAALCAPRPHRPAADPRGALTDVLLLAEGGRLDRPAAVKLLALGLYPTGSVVELADGSTAVVLTARDPRAAIHAAARPVVALLTDGDGRPLASPRYLDLGEAHAGPVVRTLEPKERLERIGRSYPEWA